MKHCPFPGMDPYLEDPSLWPDFHGRLIRALHDMLRPNFIEGPYRLAVASRAYANREEPYLEIRHISGDAFVTLLDVVSPANRTTVEGRQAYLEVRHKAQEAGANTVEIDLVLQGEPMLSYSREGLPDWQYSVSVTRSTHPDRFEIYTATLQKPLPRFRLPLAVPDRDVVCDLRSAFSHCYQAGGFHSRIAYQADPDVPLSDEHRTWLDSTLEAQDLRVSHKRVAVAAYFIWEREGRPQGRDKEHWEQALAQLRGQQG